MIDSIARCRPTSRMTPSTMDREKPDISMTLPNTAPRRNTGKYDWRNSTIRSRNTLLYIGSTSDGLVSSTASNAATGANRMTLKPR
jgi:hypothetical protein